MQKLINQFFDILYPKKIYCRLCRREAADVVCSFCLGSIRYLEGRTCLKCGKGISDMHKESWCPDCLTGKHSFDSAFSCFEYEGAGKELIHKLKYEGRTELSKLLAKLMYYRIRDEGLNVSAVIPVPIHAKKLQKRGFNQALLIAEELSAMLGVPLADCLIRDKDTKEQYGLDRHRRAFNVIDAFSCDLLYNVSNYKVLLLVDDVYTTGSTADECARVLRGQGVQSIHVITAATGSNT